MSTKNRRKIWITWERHRRTRRLAEKLNVELFEITFQGNSAARYIYCIFATVKTLYANKPDILLVQTPSYILSFLVALLKPAFKYKLVLDAHNGVTYRLENNQSKLVSLIKYAVRKSDLVIVTSQSVYPILKPYQQALAELPDGIPEISRQPMPQAYSSQPKPYITLIASFQHDEPIELILEACDQVLKQRNGHVFVTGKVPSAADFSKYQSNSNISFTGYLSYEDFDGLICNSDLLIDISTDATVLVCGGYEAIAVGVPALVSDSPVSKKVFGSGFIYSDCSVENYIAAIESFFDNPEIYKSQMIQYKDTFNQSWQKSFDAFLRKIEDL